jgi:hypothetical protein
MRIKSARFVLDGRALAGDGMQIVVNDRRAT